MMAAFAALVLARNARIRYSISLLESRPSGFVGIGFAL
jgi:hypothetical protein